MKIFNLEDVKKQIMSDNLPVLEEATLEAILKTKVEAQKWCLGLAGDELLFNAINEGVLVTNTTIRMRDDTVPVNLQTSDWITIAKRELGTEEIIGGSNSRIEEYLRTTGKNTTDETPWCSAFVNWVMSQAGYKGTNSALAHSWADWGDPVAPGTLGSIVVFTRGKGGHVGFCVGYDSRTGNIKLLGGNQSDKVRISNYSNRNVISWRWPK